MNNISSSFAASRGQSSVSPTDRKKPVQVAALHGRGADLDGLTTSIGVSSWKRGSRSSPKICSYCCCCSRNSTARSRGAGRRGLRHPRATPIALLSFHRFVHLWFHALHLLSTVGSPCDTSELHGGWVPCREEPREFRRSTGASKISQM